MALVAGSSLLAVTAGDALGAAHAATDDVAIAKLAATAELLAIDFCTRALNSRKITKSDEVGYRGAALANEKAPLCRAQGRAQGRDTRRCQVQVSGGRVRFRKSIGQLGLALETAFVGAYMGAVTALKSNALKGVAAEIGACESRHLSVLTNIGANQIVPAPDLPKVLTAAQASAALKPFFA
jgi:hypothetical protein